MNQIKKWREKTKRKNLKHETKTYVYDFQQYETVRSFGDSICARKINIVEVEGDQNNLLNKMVEFNDRTRSILKERKDKKKNKNKSAYVFY